MLEGKGSPRLLSFSLSKTLGTHPGRCDDYRWQRMRSKRSILKQNGYIESFNARLREECLNREEFWTLTEARVVIEDWRWKYNHVRPHRSLGYITPNEFAQDEVGKEAEGQCRAFGRATPSLRPSIDLLYDIEQINPSRLTKALDQFG